MNAVIRFHMRLRGTLAGCLVVIGCGGVAVDRESSPHDGGTDAKGAGGTGGVTTGGRAGNSGGVGGQSVGGAPGVGGGYTVGGAGGSGGTGARDAAVDVGVAGAGGEYLCGTGPNPDPGGDVAEGFACCGGAATCTAMRNVEFERRRLLGRAECRAGETLLCDPALVTPLSTCRSTFDIEGRCFPRCTLRGYPRADFLPTDVCSESDVCVPCYDPFTGSNTSACEIALDNPREPAFIFTACGAPGDGVCLPEALALQTAPWAAQLECPNGQLCAPRAKAADPSFCFAPCLSQTPIGDLSGACVPAFAVPEAQRPFLSQDTCAVGELCAPCLNPLDQTRTGACD